MSGRSPRDDYEYDDEDYDDRPSRSKGMSGAMKAVLAFVVFLIICAIIGTSVYFGVYYKADTKPATTTPPPPPPPTEAQPIAAAQAADPSCNYQMTKSFGRVICPVGYDTKYIPNAPYSGAPACSTETEPCDRCIGKAYPQAWKDADPTIKWEAPISIGPVDSGNRVMGYQGGAYIAEPKPVPTVAGKKCYF